MKLGRSGAFVTAVVIVGAVGAREARAQEEDRPCVLPTAYAPPLHKHLRSHASRAALGAVGDPAYIGERPSAEHAGLPVEITASAGYAFAGGVAVQGGSVALAPSPVFGATVDVGNLFGVRFEAVYVLQNTGVQFLGNNGVNQPQYDVTAHHFRLGAEYDILHGRVRPFVGLTMGAEWLAPHSNTPDELWFEASLEAGAKVRLTKALGIRAQAEVTVVPMDASSQVFCSSGCIPQWYGIGTSYLALMAGPTVGF
jgi:hypothetical protein